MITHVFNNFFNHQNHPFFGHLTINGHGFQAMADESEGPKATWCGALRVRDVNVGEQMNYPWIRYSSLFAYNKPVRDIGVMWSPT